MKKEMKFSELPEKVQEFLKRSYEIFYYVPIGSIDMDWIHNEADWTKATNDERLAYAKFMYNNGVVYKCLRSNSQIDVTSQTSTGVISDNGNDIWVGGHPGYVFIDGKWAQIIATPEEIDRLGELGKIGAEAGEKFQEYLTDNKPIFKVGDRPEWTIDLIKQLPHGTELSCASNGQSFIYDGENIQPDNKYIRIVSRSTFMYFSIDGFFAKILSLPESYLNPVKPEEEFQAGDVVEVKDRFSEEWFIRHYAVFHNGRHYVSDKNDVTPHLFTYPAIRKIDPDKHLKELAYEVWKNMLTPNKERVCFMNYTVYLQRDGVLSMLIEMGKKAQDKIK